MINPPPIKQTVEHEVDEQRFIRKGWAQFFTRVFVICFAQQQSGTTANRPTTNLYIGRRYFDTTITLPIYYTGTGWIDAAGNSV